jgi:copper transport protein
MNLSRFRLALLVALIASLIFTGTALAHALLLRSVPAANAALIEPPATLELWFSEPLEADFSSAWLLTSSGGEILPETITIDPTDPTHMTASLDVRLSPGNYTVVWQTLSQADGHDFYGNFPFTVLNPDGSRPAGIAATPEGAKSELPTTGKVLSRWLALVGGILLFSVPLFLTFVMAGALAPGVDIELENRLNMLGIKISVVAVLALIIGSWLQIVTQAIGLENSSLWLRLIYGTHTAALTLVRQALSVGSLLFLLVLYLPWPLQGRARLFFIALAAYQICLLAFLVGASLEGETILVGLTLLTLSVLLGLAWHFTSTNQQIGRRPWQVLLLFGILVLLSFSIGSHAEAVPGRFWAVIFDFIHLLASSAWLGGLMLLPSMLGKIIPRANPAPDFSPLRPLFRRYGYLAKLSFFLLLVTGVFNSLVQFPTFASLIDTSYGRILIIKLVLMVAVWRISILASQIFRRKPDPARMGDNLQKFSRRVGQSALIGLGLVAAVAILVQTQPPVSEALAASSTDTAFHDIFKADDMLAHIFITPNQPGDNQYMVRLFHEDGTSIGEVQLVRLYFDYQEAEIGQGILTLEPRDEEVFGGTGAYINQPGLWKLSLYVRRRGLDDTLVDFTLDVKPPTGAAQNSDQFQNPIAAIPVGGLFAGGMIVAGAEILRWRQTFKQSQPKLVPFIMVSSGVLIFIGLILGILQIIPMIPGFSK